MMATTYDNYDLCDFLDVRDKQQQLPDPVRDGRLWENDKALIKAYWDRYLRPMYVSKNFTKAMKVVRAYDGFYYDANMPVWYSNEKLIDPDIKKTIYSFLQYIIELGIISHHKMQNVVFRRLYYNEIMHGRLHNLNRGIVQHISRRDLVVITRHMKNVCPGFYQWCCVDRKGNKISMRSARLTSSNLCKEVVVNAHGFWQNRTGAEKSGIMFAAGSIVGSYISSYDIVTTSVIAGCVAYSVNHYMDIKAEQVLYKSILSKLDKLKNKLKKAYAWAVNQITDLIHNATNISKKSLETLIQCTSLSLIGYSLWRLMRESPDLNRTAFEVAPQDFTVNAHSASGPLMATFIASLCVLPIPMVRMMKSYRSIKGLYEDSIGPQGFGTFMRRGANFMCQILGVEPWYEIVSEYEEIQDMIDKMDNIINDPKLMYKQSHDREFYSEVTEVRAEAWKLSKVINMNRRIPGVLARTFTQTLNKIDKILELTRKTNVVFHKRTPVTVVWFPGPPGVGKSTVSRGIVKAIYEKVHKKKYNPSETWIKNSKTDYDDGYTNQWHVDIPEIFSSKLPTTNEPLANAFKLYCDTQTCPMNMSQAELKGTVFFSSKFITLTSNDSGGFNMVGVKQVSSISRRIAFPMLIKRLSTLKRGSKGSIKKLDEAWALTLTDHCKKNPDDYSGRSKYLHPDPDHVYKVSEFINVVYKHYMDVTHGAEIQDMFDDIDWEEEIDDEVPLSMNKRDKEVVDAHGFLNSIKAFFGSQYARLQNIIGTKKVETQVLMTRKDSISRMGMTAKHAALLIIKDDTSYILHYDGNLVLEEAFGDLTKKWSISEDKFYIKAKHILAQYNIYYGQKWSLRYNCQDFVSGMVVHDYPNFISKIWYGASENTALLGDASKPIDITKKYYVNWSKRIIPGIVAKKMYPQFAIKEETLIPEISTRYMQNELAPKFIKYGKLAINWYAARNVSFPVGGAQYCFNQNGIVTTDYFDEAAVAKWVADKSSRGRVIFEGDVWLVDLEPDNIMTPIIEQIMVKSANIASRYSPACVKEYVENREGIDILQDFGLAIATSYVIYKLVTPLVSKVIELMKTWLSPLIGGHSVQKTVQFQPKPNSVVVNGHGDGQDYVKAYVATNLVSMVVEYKNECAIESKAFFIDNRTALIPKHTITHPSDILAIRIRADGNVDGVATCWSKIQVEKWERSEMVKITFPNIQGAFKDMRKYHMPASLMRNYYDSSIIVRHIEGNKLSCHQYTTSSVVQCTDGTACRLGYRNHKGESVEHKVWERYTVFNNVLTFGDCSTVYLVQVDGNLKILGYHFGNVEGVAYIAPVPVERLGTYTEIVSPIEDKRIMVAANAKIIEGLTCIGKTNVKYDGPKINKILDGPILKTEFGVTGLPDINKSRATLSGPAIHKAFKYANGQRRSEPKILRDLHKQYPMLYFEGFADVIDRKLKFLSVQEAVHSNEYGIKSLDQTTSTGPYISLGFGEVDGIPRTTDRSKLFDHQTNWILPAFEQDLERLRCDHENRKMHIPLIGITFKVEMRDNAKKIVLPNGEEATVPRIFGNTDLRTLIEHKRVFGMLFEHLKNFYPITSDMVGMNPFGFGWKAIYEDLQQHPNAFTMDISGCDFCHTSDIAADFFSYVNEYFYHFEEGTKEYNRLEMACLTMSSAWYVYQDHVYASAGKNPSGCLVTCIINAFMIYVRLQKCFYYLQYKRVIVPTFKKTGVKLAFQPFNKHVLAKLFGDDGVTAVSDWAFTFFDRCTVIKTMFKLFNMKVTDAQKSSNPTPKDPWPVIDFLQRGFVVDGNMVKAPLNVSSIYKSLYFVDKKPGNGTKQDWIDFYQQVIGAGIREMAMHGEDEYNTFVKHVKCRYIAMGGKWNFPTYEDAYASYCKAYYD